MKLFMVTAKQILYQQILYQNYIFLLKKQVKVFIG